MHQNIKGLHMQAFCLLIILLPMIHHYQAEPFLSSVASCLSVADRVSTRSAH